MQKLSKWLKPKLKYLVSAVLLVVPLYPKFPFIKVPGTYVSIRLEDFLIFVLAIVLLPILFSDRFRLVKDRITRLFALFLLVGFVSLVSATLVTKTIDTRLGLLHWIRRVEYIIPFYAGFYAIRYKRRNLEFFLKTIILTVFLIFLYGFGQKYLNWPVIITQNQEYARGVALYTIPGGHLTSTFAGHYDLSSYLVLTLPFYVTLFFTTFFTKKTILERLVYLALVAVGIWLIAVSGSRISAFSFLLASSIALVLVKKYKQIILVWILGIFIFSFSTNLVARYGRLFEVTNIKIRQIQDMILDSSKNSFSLVKNANAQIIAPERRSYPTPTPIPSQRFEDRSTSIRLNVEWPRALRALNKNPLLGTGYSSITLATDSDYLRLLGEVGLFGFVSFSLIFIEMLVLIANKFPLTRYLAGLELNFIAGFLASLVGVFLNAIFIDVFEASKFAIIFWLLAGIAVSVVNNNAKE